MLKQLPSQIYKAEQRNATQELDYQLYSIISTQNKENKNRGVKVLNEWLLFAQKPVQYRIFKEEKVIILPLVGGIDYKDSLGNIDFIGTGQAKLISFAEEVSFELKNPYKEENIYYLEIRLSAEVTENQQNNLLLAYEISNRNELLTIWEDDFCGIFVGIFDGRKEAIYKLKNEQNAIFGFVINGAFELQNRLLETRDALKIWDLNEIELEALSENAIILIMETTK